jgi:hypothetical protein
MMRIWKVASKKPIMKKNPMMKKDLMKIRVDLKERMKDMVVVTRVVTAVSQTMIIGVHPAVAHVEDLEADADRKARAALEMLVVVPGDGVARKVAEETRAMKVMVDHKAVTVVHKVVMVDVVHKVDMVDHKEVTVDHRAVTVDHRVADHKAGMVDHAAVIMVVMKMIMEM